LTLALSVALVTETFPPEVNGVARTLDRLVSELRLRSIRVDVVRPRQAAEPKNQPTNGHAAFRVPGLPLPGYPTLRFGLPVAWRLSRWFRRHRPDVVHIATEGPLGWAALLVARRQSLPVTTTFHTNFPEYGRHYGYGEGFAMSYLRAFHNRAQRTLVPTAELARSLTARGVERVGVMARGVDCQTFDPARRSNELRAAWGLAESDPAVLCVGRLAPEKNVDLLVRLALDLARDVPRAKLVLVGDGPARRRLEREIPWAVFAGQRLGDDLAAHYASADVFVFPSLTDTFGNVVPEAMASGLPVVAFDRGAARDLVVDEGRVVPEGASAAFCAAAIELTRDASERRRRGEAARRRALGMEWSRIADVFERELRQAADRA
jgi:glycosyltransferase involved in cell wall biosynthesis